MQLIAVLLLLAAISFLWHYITQQRQETAKKLYFNTVAMPVLLLPDGPFDEDFPDRIERFKKELEEAGNTYRPQIIAVPYYTPIGGELQTVNVNYDKYVQMVVQSWLEAREQVAAAAYKNAPQEAVEVIAGAKNFSLSK